MIEVLEKPSIKEIHLKSGEIISLETLNKRYKSLTPEQRILKLYEDFDDILLTSSFGTTAVYQLHLFYKQGIRQPVHFIDTRYHFKETMDYKENLTKLLGLKVIDILPDEKDNYFSKIGELWKYNPDQCCQINKVDPFEKVKNKFNVWVSGLMSWQSNHREELGIFEIKKGMLKFYPILDSKEEDVNRYIEQNKLPVHPLKPLGYESIGCLHCTIKGKKRKGRWSQTIKTECGLHL